MLKYYLIIVLNLPMVLLGAVRTIRAYQVGRLSRLRLVVWSVFWLAAAALVIFTRPIYHYLQLHHLTDSTPLSIFDVFEISAIIFLLLVVIRLYATIDRAEQRLAQLNRSTSLALSKRSKKS